MCGRHRKIPFDYDNPNSYDFPCISSKIYHKRQKNEPLHLKDSFLHKINLSIFNLSLIFTLDKENVSAITPTIEQEILHLQLDTLAHRHISLQKL